MNDFPWNYVFDVFSKPIISEGLAAGEMKPRMYAVRVIDGEIQNVQELPVAQYFTGPEGKSMLGNLIRISLAEFAHVPFCLVLLSEAYVKYTDTVTEEEADSIGQKGLKHDPKASEAVMVQIYRKDENRIALLPIMPDRSVKSAPLMSGKGAGRFSSDGGDTGFRDFVRRHNEGAK